jgi:TonB-linked SusC/RagA family outer membrane protein
MKKFLLLCFSFGFAISVWAQDRVVTGKLTSKEDGSSLPGVNVVLKGTTNGTVTDAEGNYRLTVPSSGGTLVFSFIGMETVEAEIGERTVVDSQLGADIKQLSEVVVTALNMKQDVKTLSYATQQVNADKLTLARANNVTDALAGKIAGVQTLSQAGSKLGAATVVRIRGAGSINDGAPLYVIDGTPMANPVVDGVVQPYQNDINPDDIESVNVLKGPQAVALYGQRGEFGVIVMTTKRAKKGQLGIELTNNTMAENVYILPKYQNSYSGGTSPDLTKFTYAAGMPTEWQSLDGKYYPDYMDDSSWGPRMVGQDYIPWYAWIPGTKYTGKTAKLTPQPNNVRDYYNTGVNSITNLSMGKAEDNYSVRFSYTNQNQTGISPFTSLSKNTFSTQSSVDLAKWITVGANVTYASTKTHGQFDDGYGNQTTGSFNSWFHRDLDMNIMKELAFTRTPEGRIVSWNHFDPSYYGGSSSATGDNFYRGYYWWNHYAYAGLTDYNTTRNNLFGDFNVTLKLSKKFTAKAYYQKVDASTVTENITSTLLAKSFDNELRNSNYDSYTTNLVSAKEDNIMGLVTYNDKVLDDKLSINVNAGGNLRSEESKTYFAQTYQKAFLVIPDLYTLSNTGGQLNYRNIRTRKQVQSIYASGSFGYKDYLYLSWSARNDWSSALPTANNSYFYPSVGLGFVFSELMNGAIPALSFGKLRANIAQVGSDLPAYNTQIYYSLGVNKWNGNSVSGTPSTQIDPHLKPSLSTNYEIGLDLKFLENRIGVSASYYKNDRKNQILKIPTTAASGFTSLYTNVGESTSEGFELAINAMAIKNQDFSWEIGLNAAHNTSKILTVAPGITEIVGTNPDGTATGTANFGGPYGATLYHVAGQQWGQLRGYAIKRDAAGNAIINGGQYDADTNHNFGSVLPSFTGGMQNYFTYKRFKLQVNVDFQSGGKYFSLSDMWGGYSGLFARTAGVNDKGNPMRDPVSNGGGVHIKGVGEDGSTVDTYVDTKTYYDGTLGGNGIVEKSIFDMTYVKLREVNLGYNIPVSKLGSLSKVFKTASISFIGRNLWLIYTPNRDFDPSVMSFSVGENGQLPGTRSYGASIKLGF